MIRASQRTYVLLVGVLLLAAFFGQYTCSCAAMTSGAAETTAVVTERSEHACCAEQAEVPDLITAHLKASNSCCCSERADVGDDTLEGSRTPVASDAPPALERCSVAVDAFLASGSSNEVLARPPPTQVHSEPAYIRFRTLLI